MKAIIGRASCGHAVAIDLDITPENRRRMETLGYKVEEIDAIEGYAQILDFMSEHRGRCGAVR